jgi:hypothetical protein
MRRLRSFSMASTVLVRSRSRAAVTPFEPPRTVRLERELAARPVVELGRKYCDVKAVYRLAIVTGAVMVRDKARDIAAAVRVHRLSASPRL